MSTYGRIKIAGKRIPKIIRYLLIYLLAISIPASMVPLAMTVLAQTNNPAPVQLFYVTLPEQDGLTVLDTINGAANSPMYTYFSIAIGVDGTYVYYDQWEDGYAADIANPSPAEIYNAVTNPDGVQIWGNGKASDGVAPNIAGVPVVPTDANDVLLAGDVIIPYNAVPVPRVIAAQNYVLDNFGNTAYNNNDGNTNWSTDWVETGDQIQNIYRDQFDTASYNNTDGFLNWGSSPWVEEYDDGNPASGTIYVNTGDDELRFRELSTTNDAIKRAADLSGFSNATLSFTLNGSGIDGAGDAIKIQISSDGGSTWTDLETFSTDPNGATYSYDISSYISLNTTIRFIMVGDLETGDGDGERWDIDTINIRVPLAPGSSPTEGDIQIIGDALRFTETEINDSINRGVNLSIGGSCATLTFNVGQSGIDPGNDRLALQISSDGGANYSTLATYSSTADAGSKSYNISGYASADTRIRFISLDQLETGEYWTIDSTNVSWNCSIPVLFDGKDKVGASSSISMARATWATGSGTLNAFAHEMYATNEWGTAYESPVGTNTNTGSTVAGEMFQYSGLSIMACQNNTTVQIDANADGTYETTITLQEGGTYLVSGISQGAKVLSDKPVQVVLMTGDIGSNYASRDMNLLPISSWDSSYWSPVGTANGSSYPTRLFVYNPSTNGNIYVTVERYGAADVTMGPIAQRGVIVIDLIDGQGAHVYASDSSGNPISAPIFAIGTVDTTNTAYDWSFTLFPDSFLTTEALVGLGLGKDPTNAGSFENSSPLWVTTICEGGTWVYVDWNNDGSADTVDTNGDGTAEVGSDQGVFVNYLQSVRLFEPGGDAEPYDQSGARVWSRTTSGKTNYNEGDPGCKLALAWGEDPDRATAGSPGLDVGTSIPPLRPIEGTKSMKISVDTEPYTVLNPGDTTTYTITIHNPGPSILENIYVYDTVPTNTNYVQNTTKWNDTGVEPWILIPDLPGNQLPLSITGGYYLGNLPVGKTFYIQFDVLLLPGNYEDITNCVVVYSGAGPFTKCVTTPVATRDWGDLPDSYKTTAAQDGPRHSYSGLVLGTLWDVEVQGQPNDTATGDDVATSDDEDGVTRNTSQLWLPGTGVNLNIVVNGGPGIVAGWFDWNADGDITDPDEFYNFGTLPSGVNVVSLPIPAAYTAGASVFSRFRIFDPASLPGYDLNADAYYRYAEGGEVEDYFWELHEPAIDIQKYVWDGESESWVELANVAVGDNVTFRIVVRNTGNVDLTDVKVTDPLAPNCEFYIGDLAAGATYPAYTGTLANVTETFTNTANVTGEYGEITVTDDDPADVVVGEIRGTIGDFVWYDINNDGIQDDGEPGIGNVVVNLYAEDGTTLVATTNTFAADGSYLFTNLLPGNYVVEFVKPSNYDPTLQNIGDDALDSDADTTGKTATITLGSGETNLTIDAGFIALGPAIDIQKLPDLQIIPSGGTAVFQIILTNTGNVPLTDVVANDDYGCGVENIGDLAVGASYSYQCTVPGVTKNFINTANVTGYYGENSVFDEDGATVQVITTPAVGGEVFPTDKLGLLLPVILLLLVTGGAGFWLVKRRMSSQA